MDDQLALNGYIKIPGRRPLTQMHSTLKDEPRLAWGEGGLTIGCPGIDSSHPPIFHAMTLWRNHPHSFNETTGLEGRSKTGFLR